MKTVGDIIGDRKAFSVQSGLTVKQVVDYLCEKKIGAVAVCEGERVVGVFSERDLMRRVVQRGLDPSVVSVDDVMTKDVVHVALDAPYVAAKALMLGKNFRHLVVLDQDHRLRGFVSIRELLEVDIEESRELIRKLNDDYYQHDFKRPDEYTE